MVGREKTEEQFLPFEELAKQSFCTTGVFSLVGIFGFYFSLFCHFHCCCCFCWNIAIIRKSGCQSEWLLSLSLFPFQRWNINFNYQKTQYSSKQTRECFEANCLRVLCCVVSLYTEDLTTALGHLIQENERGWASSQHQPPSSSSSTNCGGGIFPAL